MKRPAAVVAVAVVVLAGCGGGSKSADPIKGVTDTSGVSTATAQRWIQEWCQASPGITRAQVRKIMGPPTQEYDDQDQWEAFNVSFTAFYDSRLYAYQLQTDTQQWSAHDRDLMHCDETRSIEGSGLGN